MFPVWKIHVRRFMSLYLILFKVFPDGNKRNNFSINHKNWFMYLYLNDLSYVWLHSYDFMLIETYQTGAISRKSTSIRINKLHWNFYTLFYFFKVEPFVLGFEFRWCLFYDFMTHGYQKLFTISNLCVTSKINWAKFYDSR